MKRKLHSVFYVGLVCSTVAVLSNNLYFHTQIKQLDDEDAVLKEEDFVSESAVVAVDAVDAVTPNGDASTISFSDAVAAANEIPIVPIPENEEITKLVEDVSMDEIKNNIHVHIRTKSTVEDNKHCGGCTILWELFNTLKATNISVSDNTYLEGREAYMNSTERFIEFLNFCPKDDLLAEPIANNKTIVIVYPEADETYCDGPGNRVHVRWILAPLGTIASRQTVKQWHDDDIVFHHSTDTASITNLPVSNILQSMQSPQKGDETDVSPELFHNKQGRSGIAWMLRKAEPYLAALTFVHEGHGMETTQMETIENVTDFLKYEYFLSYDPYTFYTFTAAMVGTVSVISPVPGLSKQDWMLGSFVGEYIRANGGTIPGIAYGMDPEELEYARRTMPELRDFLFKVKAWGKEVTVPRLLRDSYRYGKGERRTDHFEGALLVRDAFPAGAKSLTFWDQLRDTHNIGLHNKRAEVIVS